jgi:uroporphyrin-III C-methyltransferase
MPSKYYGANATLSNISTTSFSQKAIKKTNEEANKTMNTKKKEAISESSNPKVEPPVKQKNDTPKSKTPISKLSILAIALTVGLGGLVYFQGYQQIEHQKQIISTLQTEITDLKQNTKASIINDLQANINDAVNKQNQEFLALSQRVDHQLNENQKTQQQLTEQVNDANRLNQQNLNTINERLSAISTLDNNIWLISQANYFVHLAGRKIWSDQDYANARLLLKSADESLAQTNDSSLQVARQAIIKDINSLSQVAFTDSDGIILKLLGLTESVTELPLVGNGKNGSAASHNAEDSKDQSSTENSHVTNSISNWSDNLLSNASTFMDKFIKIEKLDEKDTHYLTCLENAGSDEIQMVKCQILKKPLNAEQSLYLRENIRFRLLIAAQAVPRHQERIYQQALNDVSTWTHAYFDDNAPEVKAFLDELKKLQNQSISDKNVPDKLYSIIELEKLMQTRVKSALGK